MSFLSQASPFRSCLGFSFCLGCRVVRHGFTRKAFQQARAQNATGGVSQLHSQFWTGGCRLASIKQPLAASKNLRLGMNLRQSRIQRSEEA